MTMQALLQLIIYLLVLAVVVGLVHYAINAIPVPDPLGRIIRICVTIIAIIAVVILLLNATGMLLTVAH